jgi:uncharacterized membrane protein (UPF0127 family)
MPGRLDAPVDEPPTRFRGLAAATRLGLTVPVASTHRARTLGLALLRRERAPAGLLIPRCRGVHTFGMRFPLDVFFLDERGEVVSERRGVPPFRMVRCREASEVLEVPAGIV